MLEWEREARRSNACVRSLLRLSSGEEAGGSESFLLGRVVGELEYGVGGVGFMSTSEEDEGGKDL